MKEEAELLYDVVTDFGVIRKGTIVDVLEVGKDEVVIEYDGYQEILEREAVKL